MAAFIRSLFESAFKTNAFLEFAVITGCLRVYRESIFTGLNNLESISVLRSDYGEHFGFVQGEVDQMLKEYDMQHQGETVKQWYDGYRFGNTEDFGDMENGCAAALRQIEEKKYLEELRQEGYEDILAYGVCFFRKECIIQKMDK